MKKFVPFFLALSLLTMFVMPAFAEETRQTCSAQYTVQRGDTLFKIGVKYGVDWRNIFYANGITNVLRLPVGRVLCIPAAAATAPVATFTPAATTTATATPSAKIPIITIASVVKGESVTINASNFPPNREFEVLMGPIGTRGENGVSVAVINTGSGAFTATYTIPDSLKSAKQVAIRLEGEFGFYSYNWFWQ
jgi:murein DD-endopeptidase MepM/ murein hydrolase activator NlpD